MKATFSKIKKMAKEPTHFQMGRNIKVSGKMVNSNNNLKDEWNGEGKLNGNNEIYEG
jgi:hypothetical protein